MRRSPDDHLDSRYTNREYCFGDYVVEPQCPRRCGQYERESADKIFYFVLRTLLTARANPIKSTMTLIGYTQTYLYKGKRSSVLNQKLDVTSREHKSLIKSVTFRFLSYIAHPSFVLSYFLFIHGYKQNLRECNELWPQAQSSLFVTQGSLELGVL